MATERRSATDTRTIDDQRPFQALTQVGLGPDDAGREGTPTLPRHRRGIRPSEGVGAAILVAPYILLLLVAGIIPVIYALVESLKSARGSFGSIHAYHVVTHYYGFYTTFRDIGSVMLVWLPLMMIGVVAMALLVHATPGRFGGVMRFVYYLPGALAGVANFMLWLFLLDPSVSPVSGLLHDLGLETLDQTLAPGHLPVVLALMLFFQGAGTWLVILYGGLNGISDDVLEAAALDGANGWQIAMRVKLPIIRPWVGYMALMNIAYGFQLFLEPNVLSAAANGVINPQYTPNQLSYYFAFGGAVGGTPAAAAMSVILLVITLGIGLVIVTKSGLFNREET